MLFTITQTFNKLFLDDSQACACVLIEFVTLKELRLHGSSMLTWFLKTRGVTGGESLWLRGVLTTVNIKSTTIWDVPTCSLVDKREKCRRKLLHQKLEYEFTPSKLQTATAVSGEWFRPTASKLHGIAYNISATRISMCHKTFYSNKPLWML